MKFHCPHCTKRLSTGDEHAGKLIACPHCKKKIRVPSLPQVATAPRRAPTQARPHSASTGITAAPAQVNDSSDYDGFEMVGDRPPAEAAGAAETSLRKLPPITIHGDSGLVILILGILIVIAIPVALLLPNKTGFGVKQAIQAVGSLAVGIAFIAGYIVHVINNKKLVLDAAALKLRVRGKIKGKIPYANVAGIRIAERYNEDAEMMAYDIKITVHDPCDGQTVWDDTWAGSQKELRVPEGWSRPEEEICELLQARCPRLTSTKLTSVKALKAIDGKDAGGLPVGLIPLCVLGLLGLASACMAPFSPGAAVGCVSIGFWSLLIGLFMMWRLVKKYRLGDDVNTIAAPVQTGEMGMGKLLGRQLYWAKRRPRVFASYVTLELAGMAFLIFGALFGGFSRSQDVPNAPGGPQIAGNPDLPGANPLGDPPRPQGVTGDLQLDALLAELDHRDVVAARRAASQLAEMAPNQHRAAVAEELGKRIVQNNPFLRREILAAFARWATVKEVPLLLGSLDEHDPGVRGRIIDALVRLGDARAIPPLAADLGSPFHADANQRALVQFGPAAEKEVLAQLAHANPRTRVAALDVLKHIGTAGSIPEIKKIVDANDFFVRDAARATLDAVNARVNGPGPVVKNPPAKEPPMKEPAPTGGDAGKSFIGAWIAKGGPLDERWQIQQVMGKLSIVCRYYRGPNEIGSFHAENVKVMDNTLTFLQVFDKKPIPTWSPGTTYVVRNDNGRITFAWENSPWKGSGTLEKDNR